MNNILEWTILYINKWTYYNICVILMLKHCCLRFGPTMSVALKIHYMCPVWNWGATFFGRKPWETYGFSVFGTLPAGSYRFLWGFLNGWHPICLRWGQTIHRFSPSWPWLHCFLAIHNDSIVIHCTTGREEANKIPISRAFLEVFGCQSISFIVSISGKKTHFAKRSWQYHQLKKMQKTRKRPVHCKTTTRKT